MKRLKEEVEERVEKVEVPGVTYYNYLKGKEEFDRSKENLEKQQEEARKNADKNETSFVALLNKAIKDSGLDLEMQLKESLGVYEYNIKDRKELSKVLESLDKVNIKASIKRGVVEGYRYLLQVKAPLTEAKEENPANKKGLRSTRIKAEKGKGLKEDIKEKRARIILDNLIDWALEVIGYNPYSAEDMANEIGLTDEEIDELGLRDVIDAKRSNLEREDEEDIEESCKGKKCKKQLKEGAFIRADVFDLNQGNGKEYWTNVFDKALHTLRDDYYEDSLNEKSDEELRKVAEKCADSTLKYPTEIKEELDETLYFAIKGLEESCKKECKEAKARDKSEWTKFKDSWYGAGSEEDFYKLSQEERASRLKFADTLKSVNRVEDVCYRNNCKNDWEVVKEKFIKIDNPYLKEECKEECEEECKEECKEECEKQLKESNGYGKEFYEVEEKDYYEDMLNDFNWEDEVEYQFPPLSKEDLKRTLGYNIEVLGTVKDDSKEEKDVLIAGKLEELVKYADEALGLPLHPDFVYHKGDFDRELLESVEPVTKEEGIREGKEENLEESKLNEILGTKLQDYANRIKEEMPEAVKEAEERLEASTSKAEDFAALSVFWNKVMDHVLDNWESNDIYVLLDDSEAMMPMPESVHKQFVNLLFWDKAKKLNVLHDLGIYDDLLTTEVVGLDDGEYDKLYDEIVNNVYFEETEEDEEYEPSADDDIVYNGELEKVEVTEEPAEEKPAEEKPVVDAEKELEIKKVLEDRNTFEFESGDYCYVEYKDGKLIAGGATNSGIMEDVAIDYDFDESVDANLDKLYNAVLEKHPEYSDF